MPAIDPDALYLIYPVYKLPAGVNIKSVTQEERAELATEMQKFFAEAKTVTAIQQAKVRGVKLVTSWQDQLGMTTAVVEIKSTKALAALSTKLEAMKPAFAMAPNSRVHNF